MESYAEPFIYSKEETQDFRGSLEYYNSLDLDKYKRLYIVKNPKIGTVRAWHGHKIESKLVKVINGNFCIFTIKIDNWDNPSKDIIPSKYEMDENSGILYIPTGYANAAINTEANSHVIYFTSINIDDSKKDDHRFESKFWDPWRE